MPHFGIYFLSFDGTESVEYESITYIMDKVTVAFEFPPLFAAVRRCLNLKCGSSMDDVPRTQIHVRNYKRFRCFLALKYLHTMAEWNRRRIPYTYHLNFKKECILAELEILSALKASQHDFKCYKCYTKNKVALKSFITEEAWRKHLWMNHSENFDTLEEYIRVAGPNRSVGI